MQGAQAEETATFRLDARLAADCVVLGDLALCRVLLFRDQRFPWLILVPRRTPAVEIIDLDPADQSRLWSEVAAASVVLKSMTGCHKLNVAALGNMVPQLHVHIVARFRSDAAWPQPVWGQGRAEPYAREVELALIDRLKAGFGLP